MQPNETTIAPEYEPTPNGDGDDVELVVSPNVNSSNLRQIQLALHSAGFNVEKLHAGEHQRVYSINAQSEQSHAEYPQNDAAERANNKAPQLRGGES